MQTCLLHFGFGVLCFQTGGVGQRGVAGRDGRRGGRRRERGRRAPPAAAGDALAEPGHDPLLLLPHRLQAALRAEEGQP